MDDIQIPGHECLVSNLFFLASGKKLKDSKGVERPASEVLRVTKFVSSGEEEVISFIIENSKKFYYDLDAQDPGEVNYLTLEAFKRFPREDIERIMNEEKETLDHLRGHYDRERLKEGVPYVVVLRCIVHDEILDQARSLELEEGVRIYDKAIWTFGHKKSDIIIALNENMALPAKDDVEYLLQREVRDSNVFSLGGNLWRYESFAKTVRAVYDALSADRALNLLEDISSQVLDGKSARTIRSTARCIEATAIVESLEKTLGSVTEQLKNAKPEDIDEETNSRGYDDCYLN